ncbi:glycosyltransferase family 2 protein [Deinococcus sp. UYEF24]
MTSHPYELNWSLPEGWPEGWAVPAFRPVFWTVRRSKHALVIPVINEGERIHRLLSRIRQVEGFGLVDVIIVDGGSTDGSLDPALLQAAGVSGLLIKEGSGRLSAQLRVGYAFALAQRYQGIVTIDGNNKDDPEAITAFVQALEAGVDFVQGSRFLPGGVAEHTPLLRTLAVRGLHAPVLSLASGKRWTDTTQGFRAYSRRLLVDPRLAVFRDVFSEYELLADLSARAPRLGFRCLELPTARRYPAMGKVPTKISFWRGNLNLLRVLFTAALGGYRP